MFVTSSVDTEPKQWRALVEHSLDVTVLTDNAGRVLYVSPACIDVLGYPPEHYIGQHGLGFVHPDDHAATQAVLTTLMQRPGEPVRTELRVLHRDGAYRWIEATATNWLDIPEIGAVSVQYRDISARKATEEALRRRESELIDFFETAPVGMYRLDPDGVVIWANSAELDLVGYTADEFIGQSIALVHASAAAAAEMIDHVRRGIPLENVELKLRHKDGSIRYALVSSKAIRENDRIVHTRCFTRDITSRRLAEIALEASESRYRLVTDNVSDLIWSLNMDLQVTYISPSVTQLRGLTVEEALQESITDAITPASFSTAMQLLAEGLAAEAQAPGQAPPVLIELEHTRKDGSTFWAESKVSLLRDKDLQPIGILGVTRDTTERRAAEDAIRRAYDELEARVAERTAELARLNDELRVEIAERRQTEAENVRLLEAVHRERERLDSIIQNLPGVVWELAVRPDDWSTRILFVSDYIERLSGYTVREWLADPSLLCRFIHPDDRQRVQREIAAILAAGQHGTVQFRCIARDGREVYVDTRAAVLLDDTGRAIGLRAVTMDITEQQRTAVALRLAKEEAERANEAKSAFLSRVSHELRTPLNAILGFGQLLELDPLSAGQRESVAHILSAGRHLLSLINEVLDLSRIESGHMSVSLEPVSLGELLDALLDLLHPLADERHVTLDRISATLDDLCVLADHQRLKQVLLNLLSNAVKYNRYGGRVTVTCEERGGDRVRIKVRDTGVGIEPDKLERLFSPFDRLGAENSSVEGTGLGLALSKALVEAMGGQVGVESGVGIGSIFWVELARTEPHTPRLPRNDEALRLAEPTAARPRTVLYIEDNPSNLRLVERILSHRPEVRLLGAPEGRLGLALAQEHRPDLILLDLHLPDIPGHDVLRRLRDQSASQNIPVVVVSADATPNQIERLLSGGAHAFLTKPIDVRRFLEVLDDTLTAHTPAVSGKGGL